jgi:predicted CopG family antitoxin
MANNQEQLKSEQENTSEVIKPLIDKKEKLAETPESTVELSPRDIEARAEKARLEALETAVSVESKSVEKETSKSPASRRGPINKKQREKSFKQTMGQVQKELPTSNRVFSKMIHNNFVEKTSDIVGNTVARPNALFAGAFVAFILTILTYTVAKTMGYQLSGFETIAAFIIGWVIGIAYDYLRVLITGKKS